MKRFLLSIAVLLPLVSVARSQQVVEREFDFRYGSQGWVAGFADYPPGTDPEGTLYELIATPRLLPRKLSPGPFSGFYLQGHNRSDDLFMFLKRRLTAVDGIVAGQAYRLDYTITADSNAPSGCFGIGGAPGEAVTLKAGASPIEPMAVLQGNGWLRMNVDKGDQSIGGTAASTAGNVANGLPCSEAILNLPFRRITRTHQHSTDVTANAQGELWLLIGTDSGFEGLTRLYYEKIRVRLVPVPSAKRPLPNKPLN